MADHVKAGGVWRNVTQRYVKTGGQWREVQSIYAKVSGTWRLVLAPKLANPVPSFYSDYCTIDFTLANNADAEQLVISGQAGNVGDTVLYGHIYGGGMHDLKIGSVYTYNPPTYYNIYSIAYTGAGIAFRAVGYSDSDVVYPYSALGSPSVSYCCGCG